MVGVHALFQRGQQFQKLCTVDAAAQSLAYGGDVEALATPVIVYWIEAYATECIRTAAGGGCASVGSAVSVRHLTPAYAGAGLRLTLTVLALFDKAVRFDAQLVDTVSGQLIATASHDRALVGL